MYRSVVLRDTEMYKRDRLKLGMSEFCDSAHAGVLRRISRRAQN